MNNDIVIDTTAPYVIAVISLREGVYTMGQTVDLQVNNAQPAQRVSEEQRLAAHQLYVVRTYVVGASVPSEIGKGKQVLASVCYRTSHHTHTTNSNPSTLSFSAPIDKPPVSRRSSHSLYTAPHSVMVSTSFSLLLRVFLPR